MAAGISRSGQISARDAKARGSTAPMNLPTQLIPKPSVQSKFCIKTNGPSIACVESGQAWVKTGDQIIQMVDTHGTVKDTIHTDYHIIDITLTPHGGILLSDYINKCIVSISADRTVETLFNVSWKPSGLCCLHNGDIAVTFRDDDRVVIYSISGKVIKDFDKKLFKEPFRVAQNKVNNDLYISVADKVVALDKGYNIRYEYTGKDDNAPFIPRGLCADMAGRVLITDWHSDRVHILDRDGQFLQYLLTWEHGLRWPWSIDADIEGHAWVGDGCGVKVVKYLQ